MSLHWAVKHDRRAVFFSGPATLLLQKIWTDGVVLDDYDLISLIVGRYFPSSVAEI